MYDSVLIDSVLIDSVLIDIPVAMTGAATARGFAALPPEGTIVEIAFAFGCQSKPFVRSVLPWGMKLPTIDKRSMRWQQSEDSFQEADSAGNWKRETSGSISDKAQNISNIGIADFIATAPQIWLGNSTDNALKLDSDFMNAVMATLQLIADHSHDINGNVTNKGGIIAEKTVIQVLKTKLDLFVKSDQ